MPLSIRSDRTRPTASINSNSANPTNAATIPFRITFSESVSGFIASDIGIVNGTLTSFAGSGSSYDIQVAPAGDGLVTVKVPAAVANDAAGNVNVFAMPLSIRS